MVDVDPAEDTTSPVQSQEGGSEGQGVQRSWWRPNWQSPVTLAVTILGTIGSVFLAFAGFVISWLVATEFEFRQVRNEMQSVRDDIGDDIAIVRGNIHVLQRDVGVLHGKNVMVKEESGSVPTAEED